MKVSFNRPALAEALTLVTSVVPSRTPKPILSCVKIIAGTDVHLLATDMEVGMNITFNQAEIEEPGEIVIPADKLQSIVRESVDEVLSLEASEGTCTVKGVDSHFTIFGHDAGQFPKVPEFEGEAQLEIQLAALQEGIEQSLFATAKESSRYALNGLLWEMDGKKLCLVATDGRRLAKTRVAVMKSAEGMLPEGKIIVPAKTMAILDKIGSSDEDIVKIKLIDNKIVICCDHIVISSNLVEGTFPKYEDIIPKDYNKKLKLPTDAVLSAVRRSALLTNEESRGIKLAISEGKMIFSGRAPETGDAAVEMPVDYHGEPIEIGFNPAFVVDVLRVIRTSDFDLELGEPDRPGLIRSGKDFIYVLMPINLG